MSLVAAQIYSAICTEKLSHTNNLLINVKIKGNSNSNENCIFVIYKKLLYFYKIKYIIIRN